MVIKIAGWVFTATLDFEDALLDALDALDQADERCRVAACRRIADALAPFKTMTDNERQDALRSLLRRGRFSEDDWDRIEAAMANHQMAD
jgi:predicted Fe-S protein YdhL (DUF1289 family)